MTSRNLVLCAGAILGAMTLSNVSAHALTMTECSAKYKTAQTAGTLNGMKWNDFRKAQCGSDAAAAPAATTTAANPPATPAPAAKPAAAPKATAAAKSTAAPPAAASDAVFPSAVSSKYTAESAGKARMHTCLDQYNANKTSNGNGGLNWIAKGGGYNKHLKG